MSELNNLYDRIKPAGLGEPGRKKPTFKKGGKKKQVSGRKLKRKVKRQQGKKVQHARKQELAKQRAEARAQAQQEAQAPRAQTQKAKRRRSAVAGPTSSTVAAVTAESESVAARKKMRATHDDDSAEAGGGEEHEVGKHENKKDKRKKSEKSKTQKKKKKQKKEKEKHPVLAVTDFDFGEEDREIEYLEKKLGLSGSGKDKNWQRLNKEWAKDGIGDDMGNFLQELDAMTNEWVKAAKTESGGGGGGDDGDDDDQSGSGHDDYNNDYSEDNDDSDGDNDDDDDDDDDDSDSDSDSDSGERGGSEDASSSESEAEEAQQAGGGAQSSSSPDLAYIPGQKAAREQGEDIYGRAHVAAAATTVVQKYVPPARRRQAQLEAEAAARAAGGGGGAGGDSRGASGSGRSSARAAAAVLTAKASAAQKAVKGLMNRLSDANLGSISDSFVALYRQFPRAELTECVGTQALAQLDDRTQLLGSVVNLTAALAVSLHMRKGVEVGAPLVETFVMRFLSLMEEGNGGRKSSTAAASTMTAAAAARGRGGGADTGGAADSAAADTFFIDHRKLNLAVLLVTMYCFGMLHHVLIYDICDMLAAEFSEESVEMLLKILQHCGFQLRKDDPARLLSLITAIKTHTQTRGGEVSQRLQYMVDVINDIKNNRKRGSYSQFHEARKHLQTYLNTLKDSTKRGGGPGLSLSTIRASLQDIRDSDSKGRWWLTGAAWVGNIGQHDASSSSSVRAGGDGGGDADAVDQRLLALAKAQRMNTDVRRSVFCVIMGSSDYLDAYEKLLKLNLKKVQQREIVRVLMHCCGQSATYSPYFGLLAAQLCTGDTAGPNPGGHPLDPDKDPARHGGREAKHFKFTFQLSYWDFFKEVHACNKPRRLKNMALLLAYLTRKGHLSLGLLRNVDFTQLTPQHVLFFRGFFREMLRDGHKTLCKAIHDAGRAKDGDVIRDACLVFLKMHFPLDQQRLDDRERAAYRQVVEYLERQTAL